MSETERASAAASCDDTLIWRVWLSAFHAPALAIADELGIFQALASEPSSSEALARALKLETRATDSMLALLASLDLLVHMDGRFHLTEVSRQCLLPASPYYWGGFLARIRDNPLDVRKMIEGLRRGNSGSESRVASQWETAAPPPEFLRGFTHAMHSHSMAVATRVIPVLDFAGASTFLDVGGGSGSFSIEAVKRHDGLRCTLIDFEVVCEVARDYIGRAGVSGRIDLVPHDMFKSGWPSADRAFLNDIFHGWEDERCTVLSRNAFDSLNPGGRMLVHEMVLSDEKDGPLNAAAYSMAMVFASHGRQRSAREIVEIMSGVGFCDIRVMPTSGGYAVVEGTKPA